MIIGSKFDLFLSKNEFTSMKEFSMALRCVAHTFGCDLVYGSSADKEASKFFKSMLSCHTFGVPTSNLSK